MEFFIGIVTLFIAYFVYEFFSGTREEAPERRKDEEKYSFKKMNERINKK